MPVDSRAPYTFSELYETIGPPIGEGGAATVYMCRPRSVEHKLFHVKMVSKHLKDSSNGRGRRFEEEAKFLSNLDHRNLISIIEYFDNEKVMVLEHASHTLQDHVDTRTFKYPSSRGGLSVAQKLNVLYQVITGLSYLHGNGVVHRDLCPSNILIREDRTVAIADLGMSSVGALDLPDDRLGNPKTYAPDEQARRLRDAGTPADIFAFGMIAYNLLIGVTPRGHPIPKIESIEPEVPFNISETLYRCLYNDPAKRPNVNELEKVLSLSADSEFIRRKRTYSKTSNLPSTFSDFFGVGELIDDLGYDVEKEAIRSDYCVSLDFFGIAFRNLASQEILDRLGKIGNARILMPNTNCTSLLKYLSDTLDKPIPAIISDINRSISLISSIQNGYNSIQIRTYDIAPPWRTIIIDNTLLLQRIYGGDRSTNLLLKTGDGRYLRRISSFFISYWDSQSHMMEK